MQMPSHRQQQFFRDALDAGGNVRVVLIHPAHLLVICRGLAKIFWEAGCLCEEGHSGRAWLAKQFHKTAVEGAIGGVVKAEVAHIQREGTIAVLPDQLPHLVEIARWPYGAIPIT